MILNLESFVADDRQRSHRQGTVEATLNGETRRVPARVRRFRSGEVAAMAWGFEHRRLAVAVSVHALGGGREIVNFQAPGYSGPPADASEVAADLVFAEG